VAEFDSVIPPGGSGTLTAKVATKPTQDGRLTKRISVYTDESGQRPIQLKLSFRLVAPIVVDPAGKIVLQAVVGESIVQRFSLRRRDGEELEITRINPLLGDLVAIRYGAAEEDLRTQWPEPVRGGMVFVEALLEPQLEKLRRNSGLQITTNHPDVRLLTLPMSVWVRDLIEAAPASLNLRGGAGGSRRSRAIVRVVHRGDVPFEIETLEISDPDLLSATQTTQGASSNHSIQVEVNTELNLEVGQVRRGWLEVQTSAADRSQIRVPVTVSGSLVRPKSPPEPPASGSESKSR